MLIRKFWVQSIDNYINEYENKFQITFPDEYKQFMKKYNGGYTKDTTFKVGKKKEDIIGFYGFNSGQKGLDFSTLSVMILEEYISYGYFPIGNDSFGNYILIGVKDDFGKIFWGNHERKEIFNISNSLHEFILICKSKKREPVKSPEEKKRSMIEKGNEALITPDLIKLWEESYEKHKNDRFEEVNI